MNQPASRPATEGHEPRWIFLLPQVTPGPRGGLVGGYANSVAALVELPNPHEVVIIGGTHHEDAWGASGLAKRLSDVAFIDLPMRSPPTSTAYYCEFMARATAAARRLRCSVVYGHSGHPAYALASALMARATGASSVHCIYCPFSDEFQQRRVGFIQRVPSVLGLRRVDGLAAISRNVGRSLEGLARGRNIEIIPPALPKRFYRTTNHVAADGVVTLGFVGHHRSEKGLDIALQAVQRAASSNRQVRLVILATGAESRGAPDELRELLNMFAVRDRVVLLSGVEDMFDFYNQLDFLLVPFRATRGPSDYPLVLLEALALGLPTVSTPVGAIPELVTDSLNGFLATSATGDAFADALERALRTDGSAVGELTRRARASAEAFRADCVAEATAAYLRSFEKTGA